MFLSILVWASLALGSHGRHSDGNILANYLLSMRRTSHSPRNPLASLLNIRGGEDEDLKAALDIHELASNLFEEASREVTSLREGFASGEPIANFATKVDKILDNAIEKFESAKPTGDAEIVELYESKLSELAMSIASMLGPVFLEQICMLKGAAMDSFLKSLSGKEPDAETAMVSAVSEFTQEAAASMAKVGEAAGWSFSTDRANLLGQMQAILRERRKANGAQDRSQGQMKTAYTYLQNQQQQMRELQATMIGGQQSSWDVTGAYRPPDTDINIYSQYQNGRCNMRIQLEHDEGAHALGAYGFTRGMGPANLGLRFDVHM